MQASTDAFDFDAAEQRRYAAAFERIAGRSHDIEATSSIAVTWIHSPVGPLVVGASAHALCFLEFSSTAQLDDQFKRLRQHFSSTLAHATTPLLETTHRQLDEYFAGKRHEFQLPLQFRGSDFQERVWTGLQRIPYGRTSSYGDLARELGDANLMRAVGGANGLNPIAIVIPCHRVVNANGDLGGFGGGRWRKEILLDLERGQGRMF